MKACLKDAGIEASKIDELVLVGGMTRLLREQSMELAGLARGLGDPRRLIEERQQRVDVSGERLALATRQLVERRSHQLSAARLVSPQAVIAAKEQALVAEGRALTRAADRFKSDALQKYARAFDRLDQLGDRLKRHGSDLLQNGQRQVDQAAKLLESYSFHSVLNRGFALVRDQDGHQHRPDDQHRFQRRPRRRENHRRFGRREAYCAAAPLTASSRRRHRQSRVLVVAFPPP